MNAVTCSGSPKKEISGIEANANTATTARPIPTLIAITCRGVFRVGEAPSSPFVSLFVTFKASYSEIEN